MLLRKSSELFGLFVHRSERLKPELKTSDLFLRIQTKRDHQDGGSSKRQALSELY